MRVTYYRYTNKDLRSQFLSSSFDTENFEYENVLTLIINRDFDIYISCGELKFLVAEDCLANT